MIYPQRRWSRLNTTGTTLSILLLLFLFPYQVLAQGFMVKPMTVEFTPRPGQMVERTIEIRNTLDHAETIEVLPVLIKQSDDGSLTVVDSQAQPDLNILSHSCYSWVELSARQLDLPAVGTASFIARMKVPATARGFYSAGIVAHTTAKTIQGSGLNIGVEIRFLIMIYANISGPQVHEQIVVTDISLHHPTSEAGNNGSTSALFQVQNQGETCSSLLGKATILCPNGHHWRRITDAVIPTRSIFPGMTIAIPVDLKRKLPPGHYRLVSALKIGGRSAKPLDKELDYEGELGVTTVQGDVTLQIDQREIDVKAVPGSLRSTNLTLTNPTEQAVQVKCIFAEPETLKGVALGKRVGDDFSCANWGQITPDTLLLRGGERRNVRLTFQFPQKNDDVLPYYYANLIVQTAYEDGQNAGEAKILAIIQNTKVSEPESKAMPVNMRIAQGEDDKYIVTAKFANIGEVHFIPHADAQVTSVVGEEFAQVPLETAASQVLPLGTPEFSGILNFTKVPAGVYLVKMALTDGKKLLVSSLLPIRVEDKNGKKVVTVVEDPPSDNNGKAESGSAKK